jgi:hypothetical protein
VRPNADEAVCWRVRPNADEAVLIKRTAELFHCPDQDLQIGILRQRLVVDIATVRRGPVSWSVVCTRSTDISGVGCCGVALFIFEQAFDIGIVAGSGCVSNASVSSLSDCISQCSRWVACHATIAAADAEHVLTLMAYKLVVTVQVPSLEFCLTQAVEVREVSER